MTDIWIPSLEDLSQCSKAEVKVLISSLSLQSVQSLQLLLERSKGMISENIRTFILKYLKKPTTSTCFGRSREYYLNSSGIRCAVDIWTPEIPPIATLIFCHGLFDHPMLFSHVLARFVEEGYFVVAPTLPGWGDSNGKRWLVKKIDDFAVEIPFVFDRYIGCHPNLSHIPHFVMGHSMGGVVAILAAFNAERLWSNGGGLLLSSPLLALDPSFAPPVKRFITPIAKVVAPKAPMMKPLKDSDMCRRCHFRSLSDDPRSLSQGIPIMTGYALLQAERSLKHKLTDPSAMKMPIFVQSGSDDEISDIRMIHSLKTLKNAKVRIWPGLKHDLLRETAWRDVVDRFLKWSSSRSRAAVKAKVAIKCRKDWR
ncbi:alpha/beta hydrolase [Aduncisulcus paluster]|uniref:Alpha/beta hydrolase n=1 Tax=Aduncisulcus paluster TaxID=2918883 RepID=A0ABQ5KBH6_9EUKA|nr:alpha/beta hydrolase [Aduncisulcus paluster]